MNSSQLLEICCSAYSAMVSSWFLFYHLMLISAEHSSNNGKDGNVLNKGTFKKDLLTP